MDSLIEGYRRFLEHVWPQERARYEALADQGERRRRWSSPLPTRAWAPQTMFGTAPGELFVVRNVGALVPLYQPDAGYHGTSAADFLKPWMRLAEPPSSLPLRPSRRGMSSGTTRWRWLSILWPN
jgi:hypothetical protein